MGREGSYTSTLVNNHRSRERPIKAQNILGNPRVLLGLRTSDIVGRGGGKGRKEEEGRNGGRAAKEVVGE